MKPEYIIRAMMIAQYLEMIEQAEAQLDILEEGLANLLSPEFNEEPLRKLSVDPSRCRLN